MNMKGKTLMSCYKRKNKDKLLNNKRLKREALPLLVIFYLMNSHCSALI
jgi:hypothetical protein